jgi:hypothetical protein
MANIQIHETEPTLATLIWGPEIMCGNINNGATLTRTFFGII